MRGRTAARGLCRCLLLGLGFGLLGTFPTADAAPHIAGGALERPQQGGELVVEIAKKRKRKSTSQAEKSEPEAPDFRPGPDDRLIVADGAQVLIKPLTPSETYRAGQSVFLSFNVGRRKGSRAKAAAITVHGDVAEVQVFEAKDIKVKLKDGRTLVTVPLAGGSRSLAIELRLREPAAVAGAQQSLVSQVHVGLSAVAENVAVTETVLAFPLADCTTAYHQALGRLYGARRDVLEGALKSVVLEDESLPGEWLFPPRKLSKAELAPKSTVIAPPRRECRWAIDTVSFSTRKSERICKKWELVEVALTPTGAQLPMVDETRAQAINKRAGGFIESRTAARDFGKSGKLEWISKRILTDVRSYLQQEPHPALCAGVDIMTSYFVDNAVTLRKELAVSDEALLEARRIAQTRLAALGLALGRPLEEPAETASISLITAARAAPVTEAGASAALIGEAGRLLLSDAQSARVEAEPRLLAKLGLLRDGLATGGLHSEMQQRLIADALTAVEAAAYLEMAAASYSRVGDAIFGSISAINKAHGESCTCAP